ncbi:MAG: response regulator, partial [Saprospiraceae bacterium]|nr:response regulator [Saprospiraceae bacterium]
TLDLPIIREHPTWLQLVNYLALALIDISYFQFIRHFLDLETNDEKWNKWFKRIIQLKILFYIAITSFHYITYNEPLADSILSIFLVSGFLFTIIFISFLYRKKEVRRKLVLAGTIIIFLAIVLNAVSIIQGKGLWTLFTEAGLGLEIILFSFALAYRMKVLRQEEQKAKTIREIDALKNKFFTNISHEFRTPLTIINGVTEIGKEKIKSLDTAGLHQSMTKIKNQSDKLLNLVNQVLGLTKLETKSMKLSTRRIPLIHWVEMVVSEFDEYATQKDINLRFHSDIPACDTEVDDRQLKTVVTNFLSNALKFTEPGGTIKVGCNREKSDQVEGIVISVKDSGIGIHESDLTRIFDRYYQADDERAIVHSGMGVGLSMSKEIVELMGGKIEVESKLNEGTVFSIWLPLKMLPIGDVDGHEPMPDEKKTALPILSELPGEEKPIILIIDDHPEMVELLSEMLSNDFSLIKAYQGEEGLQKALEHIPDIIIADVMMPVMDGLELCEKLKSNVRTNHIPVILLTAKTENQDRIKGYKKGADVYLTKPFEKQELLIIINNLYALRKTLQEKYSHFTFIEDKEKIKTDDSFIHQVHQILEENLSDADLSVEAMAKKLFMSRMQLHRKIKAISDKSASHYIRSYRLHKSRLLLKDLNASISDVAYDVGFQSPNYFSRSFNQEFGITPSDFRASIA